MFAFFPNLPFRFFLGEKFQFGLPFSWNSFFGGGLRAPRFDFERGPFFKIKNSYNFIFLGLGPGLFPWGQLNFVGLK